VPLSTENLEGENKGRVLRFRPRNSKMPSRLSPPSPVEDLGRYERTVEPDNFRHRMTMNGLALAATIVLVLVGIWIADTMAQMRKGQDCVLIGRPGCTPVKVPVVPG
jgi:hypothetical protein